jgi:heptosyltransferase III
VAEKRGKILVVRGGAIGDFILTLPAISALRTTFPDTHLEVLGYPNVAELARAGGLIDGFRSIEAGPLSRFFARNAKLDPGWMEYFESFNLIISYLYDPDEVFRTNVGRASKAQFIQGRHRPDEEGNVHATAVFLKPLEQLAIFDPDPAPRIFLRDGDGSGLALPPGKWIAIHPGSGSERKNWPVAHWKKLLQWILASTDRNIVLVGGEAEGGRVEELARELDAKRVRRAERLPLSELAALLARSELFLGHDSGITHLAAAVGCRGIVLWGPSKRAIWQPSGEGVRIIEAADGNLERLAVEAVIDAIEVALR